MDYSHDRNNKHLLPYRKLFQEVIRNWLAYFIKKCFESSQIEEVWMHLAQTIYSYKLVGYGLSVLGVTVVGLC